MPSRIGSLLGIALLLVMFTRPATAQVPGSERCSDQTVIGGLERVRQLPSPPQVLFDGRTSLAKSPVRRIAIPAPAYPAAPACVLLSVTFAEQGGTLYVEQTGYIVAAGQGMAVRGRGEALYEAGTRVLREMVQQELLPTRPRPGVRYLVAVPIASNHPLYGSTAPVAAAGAGNAGGRSVTPTLLDHGYRDARFLRETDGAQLHLIAERGERYWFALVRSLRPDEPVLDSTGERTRQRFQQLVAPNIRDSGALHVTVEVRHYAAGTKIAHQPDSSYVHNEVRRHPVLEHAVDVPVAVEHWTGERRSPTGPFNWSSQTRHSDLNTVAAIQSAQNAAGARVAARASEQAARDAEQVMWVRASRKAMEDRERIKPARYAAARLTYQSPSYWSAFSMGRELHRVYDGYYPDARRDWVFGRIYFHAVATYGDTCRALLPAGSVKRTTTWYNVNDTGRTPGKVEEVYIHRDYVRAFESWGAGRADVLTINPDEVGLTTALGNIGGALAAGMEVQRVKNTLRDDMQKFFSQPCQSGAVVQFMENLRRLGDGLRTLQAERAPETLAGRGDAPATIGEACETYDHNNGGHRNTTWCRCLDRVLTPRYSPAELTRTLENHTALMERANTRWRGDHLNAAPVESIAADACRN